MANDYIRNVYDCVRRTNAAQQAVLVALAFHSNAKSRLCFPSTETLARETRLGLRTVKGVLKKLRELGYISWVSGGRKSGGRSMANSYTFNLPSTPDDGSVPIAVPPPQPLEQGADDCTSRVQNRAEQGANECMSRVQNGAEQGANECMSRVQLVHPNNNINNKRTTTITTIQPRVGDDVFVEMFDEFWNEYPNCVRKTGTVKCRKEYCSKLAAADNPQELHARILVGLKKWKNSENWSKEEGKYIHMPLNWLKDELWEDDPKTNPTMKAVSQQALAEKTWDWSQCAERCLNCIGNSCKAGYKVPPNHNPVYQCRADECPRFISRPDYHPQR